MYLCQLLSIFVHHQDMRALLKSNLPQHLTQRTLRLSKSVSKVNIFTIICVVSKYMYNIKIVRERKKEREILSGWALLLPYRMLRSGGGEEKLDEESRRCLKWALVAWPMIIRSLTDLTKGSSTLGFLLNIHFLHFSVDCFNFVFFFFCICLLFIYFFVCVLCYLFKGKKFLYFCILY